MRSNDNSILNQLQGNPADLSKSVIDQNQMKDVTKTNFNDLTGLLGTSALKQDDQSNLLSSSNLNDASGLEKLDETDQISTNQIESESNSITVQNQVNLPMIDRD